MAKPKIVTPRLVRYAAQRAKRYGHSDSDLFNWEDNAVHYQTGKPLSTPREYLELVAKDMENNVNYHWDDASPAEIRQGLQGATAVRRIARMSTVRTPRTRMRRLSLPKLKV